MKFFIWSVKGFSLSLAMRLQAEGNEVTFYQEEINPKSEGRVGQGIVPLVRKPLVPDGAVVLFDFSGSGRKADDLRKRGFAVLGGGTFNDALEHNRMFATQLMKAIGIKVPTSCAFASLKEGIQFVQEHPKPLVFKPHGKEYDAALTVVGEDNEQLVKDMQRIARIFGDKLEFELQEKVGGIEVSIEGWFNGTDWIFHSINSTLEEKRFLTGGLGPNTGCMGNVVFFYRHARPRLAKDTLFKLTSYLRRVDYRGPLDINTKGGYALEFTPRFGYDAIQAMVELLDMELGKVFADTAKGQLRAFRPSFDFSCGITCSIPPFPGHDQEELAESQGTPVRVPDNLIGNFHYGDVMLDEEGDVVAAGSDGVMGVMTAVAGTVTEARKLAYKRVEQVKAPDLQYRLDIGERAVREVPIILKEVGGDGD